MERNHHYADGGASVSLPAATAYRTGLLPNTGRALYCKNPGSQLSFPALASIEAAPSAGPIRVWVDAPTSLIELGQVELNPGSSVHVGATEPTTFQAGRCASEARCAMQ